jgi:hypothetical protein
MQANVSLGSLNCERPDHPVNFASNHLKVADFSNFMYADSNKYYVEAKPSQIPVLTYA